MLHRTTKEVLSFFLFPLFTSISHSHSFKIGHDRGCVNLQIAYIQLIGSWVMFTNTGSRNRLGPLDISKGCLPEACRGRYLHRIAADR